MEGGGLILSTLCKKFILKFLFAFFLKKEMFILSQPEQTIVQCTCLVSYYYYYY